jgi:hypothetical protein
VNEKARRISELKEKACQLLCDEGRVRIRAGDQEYVESAICYLEADPYFDGTGFVKSALVRYLKLVPFTPSQQERLRALVLRVVDSYGPFSGKHVCRLAASVQSPELLAAVRERLKSPDYDIRKRARNVYDYVRQFNKSNPEASAETDTTVDGSGAAEAR